MINEGSIYENAWKIKNGLVKKFAMRKYTDLVPPLEDNIFDFIDAINAKISPTCKNYQAEFWDAMRMEVLDQRGEKIAIFISPKSKVHIELSKNIHNFLLKNDIKKAIIVTELGINTKSKAELCSEKGRRVEFLNITESVVPFFELDQMPEFRKLSRTEKQILEQNFGTLEQIPVMLHSDPIASYAGFKKGDVVEIKRYLEKTGTDISYRYVSRKK